MKGFVKGGRFDSFASHGVRLSKLRLKKKGGSIPMHKEAYEFLAQYANNNRGSALDIGGRNINGTPRTLWPNMEWSVIDKQLPTNERELFYCHYFHHADATTWEPPQRYDLIICTEVLEHTAYWTQILETAYKAINVGGLFLITAAAPGRPPHSEIDGAEPRSWEYYQNILPHKLGTALRTVGFRVRINTNTDVGDVYAEAIV